MSLKDAIYLYDNKQRTVKGVKYKFIDEIEDELIDHKTTDEYSFRFTRELIWYIEDNSNNRYQAFLTEYGDYENDMSLEANGDIVFDLI